MIQYFIFFIHKIQNKIEQIYLEKVTQNILIKYSQYHLIPDQELIKLWIKMKEITKNHGIKKTLLNNYLFIIYRSFLENIGLYYIDKRNYYFKKNIISLFLYQYSFISIHHTAILLVFLNRYYEYTLNKKDLTSFLYIIKNNFSTQTSNNFYSDPLQTYLLFSLYYDVYNTNYIIVFKDKVLTNPYISFFSWFQSKNTFFFKQSFQEQIRTLSIVDLHKLYLSSIVNQQTTYFLYNSFIHYEDVIIPTFTTNSWNQTNTLFLDSSFFKQQLIFSFYSQYPIQSILNTISKNPTLFKIVNQFFTCHQYQHPFSIQYYHFLQLLLTNTQKTKKNITWKSFSIPFNIPQQQPLFIPLPTTTQIFSSFQSYTQTSIPSTYTQQLLFRQTTPSKILTQTSLKQINSYFLHKHPIDTFKILSILTTSQPRIILSITPQQATTQTLQKIYLLFSQYHIPWYISLEINPTYIANIKKKIKKINESFILIVTPLILENIITKKEITKYKIITIIFEPSEKNDTTIFSKNIPNTIKQSYKIKKNNYQNTSNNEKHYFLTKYDSIKKLQISFIYYLVRLIHDLTKLQQKKYTYFKQYLNDRYYFFPQTQKQKIEFKQQILVLPHINTHKTEKNKTQIHVTVPHIQKKTSNTTKKYNYRKQICSFYCTSLQYNNTTHEKISDNTLKYFLYLIHFSSLEIQKQQKNNHNKKIFKNDDYIYSKETMILYKQFIQYIHQIFLV